MIKAFQLLSRFIIGVRDWGLDASFSFVFLSRFFPNVRGATLRPLNARFSHRGRCDRPVLAQFFAEFGVINTSGGEPIRTIIDAGANIGVFCAISRRLYPSAQILALEVEGQNYEVLQANAKRLGNTTAIEAALWKESGSVYLNLGPNPESHSVGDAASDTSLLVPALSLQDLMTRFRFEKLDLLKMDIEGAESIVVNSLSDDTLKCINAIRFECNDSDAPGNALKMLSRLSSDDFDAYAFDENIYLIRRSTRWKFQRHYSGVGEIPTMQY